MTINDLYGIHNAVLAVYTNKIPVTVAIKIARICKFLEDDINCIEKVKSDRPDISESEWAEVRNQSYEYKHELLTADDFYSLGNVSPIVAVYLAKITPEVKI